MDDGGGVSTFMNLTQATRITTTKVLSFFLPYPRLAMFSIPFRVQRSKRLSWMSMQEKTTLLFPSHSNAMEAAVADSRRRHSCNHNQMRRGYSPPDGCLTAPSWKTARTATQRFLPYPQQRRFLHEYAIRGTMVRTPTTKHNNNDSNETCGIRQEGLALNDLRVGQYAEMERVYMRQDVETFSALIGDYNPLHQEWSHPAGHAATATATALCQAETSATTTTKPILTLPKELLHHPLVQWTGTSQDHDNDGATCTNGQAPTSKILVHGMLVASMFSGILGTLFPGCVYRGQSLQFRNPVFCHDRVVGRVTITAIKPTRVRQQRQQQQREATEGAIPEEHNGVILMCDTLVLSTANVKNGQRLAYENGDAVELMTTVMNDPNGDGALDVGENEEKVVEYIRGKATVWLVP